MAKLNPFAMARPKPRTRAVVLKDASQPGQELCIELRSLGPAGKLRAHDYGNAVIDQYFETHTPLVVDGFEIELSKSLCYAAAMIYCMQTATADAERYSIEDIIALSETMPRAFEELSLAAQVINEQFEGNARGAIMGISSESPSTSSELILNSSTDPTLSVAQ